MSQATTTEGEPIVLQGEDDTHMFRRPEPGATVDVEGVGVIGADLLSGVGAGDTLRLGRRSYLVLEPTPQLVFQALERRAQIIRPADAARIAHLAAIGPGSRVVEGGAGSGALTAYMAFLVGRRGEVVAVDRREEHLEVARRNVETAGLGERVSFRLADLGDVEERCDAFVVDVPDPVGVLEAAERCLRPGGCAVFYNPLVAQLEEVRSKLAGLDTFARARSLEVLEREWVVHERGARPDFSMLGHTGFLTVATRVNPPR